jgi:RNA ligase
MVYLSDIMDPMLLAQHGKNGLVTTRFHESLPLAILNYTPECQFTRAWDDVTKKCRGLIYNTQTLEVVARPFEKFGNWDESGYPYPPSGPALRMEKMDGSLGILYQHKTDVRGGVKVEYGVATRGSFHSEQAQWATEFFSDQFEEFFPVFGKTYLFEIIYPENRIVVNYGDYEGLVLIDVIDNETGFSDTDEFDNCDYPEKVVRHPVAGFDSGQTNDIPQGEEGFVFLWPTRNFRTKMKSAEYVEIHRMISNLSEKSVWEALVAGKTVDQIKIGLPEEFHGWIDEVAGDIMKRALIVVEGVQREFELLTKFGYTKDRKTFAHAVKENSLRKYLFLMLDNKPIYPVALRDSKPVKETSLTREG